MKINVLVRGKGRAKTYWVPSPIGEGELMQIEESEVEAGLKSGLVQIFTPNPLLTQAMRDEEEGKN